MQTDVLTFSTLGLITHPTPARMWQEVERLQGWHFKLQCDFYLHVVVTKMYTSPTAIRALMACGDSHVAKADRSSLRVIGTVGEPINPKAWLWLYEVVGNKQVAIVDTYWQTETGGHVSREDDSAVLSMIDVIDAHTATGCYTNEAGRCNFALLRRSTCASRQQRTTT